MEIFMEQINLALSKIKKTIENPNNINMIRISKNNLSPLRSGIWRNIEDL